MGSHKSKSAALKKLRAELEKKVGHVALYAVTPGMSSPEEMGANRPNWRSVTIGYSGSPKETLRAAQRWFDREMEILDITYLNDKAQAVAVLNELDKHFREQSVEKHDDGTAFTSRWYGLSIGSTVQDARWVVSMGIHHAVFKVNTRQAKEQGVSVDELKNPLRTYTPDEHDAIVEKSLALFTDQFRKTG